MNFWKKIFHHKHKSLPRPSDQVFRAKCHVAEIPLIPNHSIHDDIPIPSSTNTISPSIDLPNLFKSIQDVPTPTSIPSHDPLALPHCVPTPPFNPDQFTYQPPSVTTT